MDRVEADLSRSALSGWEVAIALTGSFVVLVAIIAWTGPTSLSQIMGRHPWLDEVLTLTLANDPSPQHMLQALSHCIDTAPPGHAMLLRSLGAISAVPISVAFIRWVALSGIAVAGWGVYVVLRTAMGRLPAMAGALVLLGHPTALSAATDGRVYGSVLGMTALLAVLLRVAAPAEVGTDSNRIGVVRAANIGGAAAALMMCLLHYLAAIYLFALAIGETWARRRMGWRRAVLSMWPVLAGPLALAGCLPLLIAQRHSQTVATWVPPLNAAQTVDFLCELLAPATLFGVVAAFYLAAVFSESESPASGGAARRLTGLGAFALVPFLLIAVSWAFQPTLIARYGSAAIFWPAVVAGLLCMKLNRRFACLAAAAVLLIALGVSAGVNDRAMWGPAELDRIADDLRALPEPWRTRPVVFASRLHFYPLASFDADLRGRAFMLDFDDSPDTLMLARLVWERDQARSAAKMYPQFPLMRVADMPPPGEFVLVGAETDLPSLLPKLKGFSMRKNSRWIYEVRRDAP